MRILGKNLADHELELKQEIGFAFGDVDFYNRSKLKTLTDVIRKFYKNWSDETYYSCLKRLKLDENKKVSELSTGMKVKYNLALALSHGAKLLILDEPTSRLVPVARDHLLEIFQELVAEGEISILFSTHITSDLEKCADYITFIENGHIPSVFLLDHNSQYVCGLSNAERSDVYRHDARDQKRYRESKGIRYCSA